VLTFTPTSDGVSVLPGAETFVPHSIDRGTLQFAPISLGRGCNVGIGSSLLPFTEVKDGAGVGPLSVVLKGEVLPEGKYAEGNPTVVHDDEHPTTYADRRSVDDSSCWELCCCCACCQELVSDIAPEGHVHYDDNRSMHDVAPTCTNHEVPRSPMGYDVVGDYMYFEDYDSGTDFDDYW